MMITLMLVLAFSGRIFAQQTNVADQTTRQQAEAIVMKYVDIINNGDAKAYTELFLPNAIDINPFGKFKKTGAQAPASLEITHKLGLTLKAKVDDVEPIFGGQGVLATAPYTGTFTNNPTTPNVRGNMLFVLEREGGSWKIRAQTASRLAPSAAMQ